MVLQPNPWRRINVNTIVVAHRGAKLEAPENSMSAFQRAVDAGSDMIEFDVRMTKDEIAVVMHDETIDRTTDGTGKVADKTWAELRQVTIRPEHNERSMQPIPTLREVLEFAKGQIRLNIEIKDASPICTEHVVKLIDETCFPLSDLIISAFDFNVLQWIYQRRTDINLAPLFSAIPPDFGKLPGMWVHPNVKCVDKLSMNLFQQAGRKVNVWTVNDPVKQRELISLGVDGIITDDPRALGGLLRKLGKK